MNPDLPRLFQKERIASKKFDIHDFETIVFFERAPKGENKISNMMPDLTTILEKPRLTNHSIRTQSIQTLIRLGFSEHEVTQFTGKRNSERDKSAGIFPPGYIRQKIF